jgi:hypothetical protein
MWNKDCTKESMTGICGGAVAGEEKAEAGGDEDAVDEVMESVGTGDEDCPGVLERVAAWA